MGPITDGSSAITHPRSHSPARSTPRPTAASVASGRAAASPSWTRKASSILKRATAPSMATSAAVLPLALTPTSSPSMATTETRSSRSATTPSTTARLIRTRTAGGCRCRTISPPSTTTRSTVPIRTWDPADRSYFPIPPEASLTRTCSSARARKVSFTCSIATAPTLPGAWADSIRTPITSSRKSAARSTGRSIPRHFSMASFIISRVTAGWAKRLILPTALSRDRRPTTRRWTRSASWTARRAYLPMAQPMALCG